VDLLPIITEQINPQNQFTTTIQIPSYALQVDVKATKKLAKKKSKKRFQASGKSLPTGIKQAISGINWVVGWAACWC
jgi:hypothetical protein